MPSDLLSHLQTWSAQALLLTAAGAIAALTLADAKARLIFWQGLLLALLLLPAIEPWRSSPMVVIKTTPATVAVAMAGAEAAQSGFTWNWLLVIGAGAALRIVWIAAGFLRLRGFRKRATLLTEPPIRFASSSARWYVSHTLPGPVTYGWQQPSILLPARVMQLPSSLREAIACHELMHVRRRDWLFVLAEETVRSLLWFHPAVWYVLSRIQLAREQVVDREVVRLTEDRDGYLEALVEVASQRLQPDPGGLLHVPAPLFLRKRHLAMRVAAVLKEVSMSKSHIAARLTAVCSAMFVAAVVGMWFIPFVSPAQTVMDDPGVTVDAGATLMHRAAVRNPSNASGIVTLEASLNAKGEVTDAHVLSGPDDLRKEALSSVLQWHYNPGLSRVQISMRFEPNTKGVRTGVSGALPPGIVGVIGGVPGGRSGPREVASIPPPPAAAAVRRVTSIEFAGFSPEAERELRDRLPVHEGDTVTPEDMARVSSAVREFDSHAAAIFSQKPNPNGTPEWALRISVFPNAIVFRNEAVAQTQAPSADSPAPRMIGGAVMQANRITIVTPTYPPLAKSARIQGIVKLTVTIAPDGTVRDAQFVSGPPLLVPAAKDAVMQWVYKPTTLNGEAVAVQTDVEVNFTLAQ